MNLPIFANLRALTGAAFLTATLCITPALADRTDEKELYEQLTLFGDVLEQVRRNYVDAPSDKELIEAALSGLMTSLDPHSSYLPPKGFEDMQVETKGEFGGLGIEVTMEGGYVKVVSPIAGPALSIKAGSSLSFSL